MKEKWYKGLYRRNLVDMHIADWDKEFLSNFDIDAYCENLKIGKIQSPMLYLQSHTGLCYYPTKTAKMHDAFQQDPYKMCRLVEKCKENGMTPVGYYSLIYNNWAEEKHPEWAMRTHEGKNYRSWARYGLCCPNNAEYRVFVEEQIKELSENFNVDAMFYDMPFWPMMCHCDSCKAKWKELYTKEMPIIEIDNEDWQDQNVQNYVRMLQVWMADFVRFVEGVSKKYMPNATVEFNYASAVKGTWLAGTTEDLNDCCEFASGDLYGDIYSQSFACKYFLEVSKNQPFEYMTSRCDANLSEHTVLKSENRLIRETLLTAAHHGASLMIDAIDPVGTLDRRVYELLGKVFEKQIPHEKYFTGEYVSDVGVLFDVCTQQGTFYGYKYMNKFGAENSVRRLVEAHIPSTVVANATIGKLNQHKLVIAPCLDDSQNENIVRLVDYVKEGGKLLLTMVSDKRLMREFFGAERKGFTEEKICYMRPTAIGKRYFADFEENYPAPVKYQMPIYEVDESKTEILAKLTLPRTNPADHTKFSSIHSNPPFIKTEIPCAMKTKYGKGEVIWLGAAIEHDNRESYKKIFMAAVNDLLAENEHSLYLNSSEKVEVTLFKDVNRYIVHLIDLYLDENMDRAYELKIPMESPKRIFDGETEKEIPFIYLDGCLEIKSNFNTFATLIIEL